MIRRQTEHHKQQMKQQFDKISKNILQQQQEIADYNEKIQ